jgi:hypothetical protein
MREVYSKKVRPSVLFFDELETRGDVADKACLSCQAQVPTATILPLYLSEKDLDSRSMLSMCAIYLPLLTLSLLRSITPADADQT